MNTTQIDVLVLLDITDLKDKKSFENHIKKEGFIPVENESFVYTGRSSTTLFATKAYILEVFAKGLKMQNFDKEASLIFLLNETPYPTYFLNNSKNEFIELKR